jgi:hypothetical protein
MASILLRIDYDVDVFTDQQLINGIREKFEEMSSTSPAYGPHTEDKPVPIVSVLNP